MKEVLKVVSYMRIPSSAKHVSNSRNFLEEIYNDVFPDSTRQFDSVRQLSVSNLLYQFVPDKSTYSPPTQVFNG